MSRILIFALLIILTSCSKNYNVHINEALLGIVDGKSEEVILKNYKQAYEKNGTFLEEESYHNALLCACKSGNESDFLFFGSEFTELGICMGYFDCFDTICPVMKEQLMESLALANHPKVYTEDRRFIDSLLDEDQRVRQPDISVDERNQVDSSIYANFMDRYAEQLPSISELGVSCYFGKGIDQSYVVLYWHWANSNIEDYFLTMQKSVFKGIVPSYYLGAFVDNRFHDLHLMPFYSIQGELVIDRSVLDRRKEINLKRKKYDLVTIEEQAKLVKYWFTKGKQERGPYYVLAYSLPLSFDEPEVSQGFIPIDKI